MSRRGSGIILPGIGDGQDPSSRRDFIRMAANTALVGAAGSLLTACRDGSDALLAPSQAEVRASVLSVGGPHRIYVSSPRSVLRYGTHITISATIQDSRGRALANTIVGVHDGMRFMSTFTKTDSRGRIAYGTSVGVKGAAVIEFVVDGHRYPMIFQATSNRAPYCATSAALMALSIRNRTKAALTSRLHDSNGRDYVVRISKSATKGVIAVKNVLAERVTVSGGVTLAAPVGEVSVTVDNRGVGTVTVTGGQAHIRGSVYGTTQADIGLCWAPGGQMGVGSVEVSGEVSLCLGTDGLSVGASGSLGGGTGGFSIDVI